MVDIWLRLSLSGQNTRQWHTVAVVLGWSAFGLLRALTLSARWVAVTSVCDPPRGVARFAALGYLCAGGTRGFPTSIASAKRSQIQR